MSESYTKLFASILHSTLWQEPAATRLVFISLLAMCSKRGEVYTSVPGLAHSARVSLEECEVALLSLSSPDKWSRTPDHEGRRIAAIDGGWRLLNHAKFDAIRNAQERAEYKRKWDRENRPARPNAKNRTPDKPPTESDTQPTTPTPLALTPSVKKRARALVHGSERFEEFWAAYDKRLKRSACEKKWISLRLDSMADAIIADVTFKIANDRQWIEGFQPHPLTYINNQGWEDEVQQPRAQPVSKTLEKIFGLDSLRQGNRGLGGIPLPSEQPTRRPPLEIEGELSSGKR